MCIHFIPSYMTAFTLPLTTTSASLFEIVGFGPGFINLQQKGGPKEKEDQRKRRTEGKGGPKVKEDGRRRTGGVNVLRLSVQCSMFNVQCNAYSFIQCPAIAGHPLMQHTDCTYESASPRWSRAMHQTWVACGNCACNRGSSSSRSTPAFSGMSSRTFEWRLNNEQCNMMKSSV